MTIHVITSARRRSRRRFLLAVIVGVVVLAALVYPAGLYVNSRLDDETPTVIEEIPPPSTVQNNAVTMPDDVTWTIVAGVALPGSSTTGPREQHDGLARGFAHTPTGAVVAAVHLLVRTTPQVGPDVFTPTLRDQVVGDHATAMRTFVAETYHQLATETGVEDGGPIGTLPAALAGARITSYTEQQTRIGVLTVVIDTRGRPHFAATDVTVVWSGTDWSLLAPHQGRWDQAVRTVTSDQAGTYPSLAGGR